MKLVLTLTHRCNLRCTYCYAGTKHRRSMSLETASKALDLGFGEHLRPGRRPSGRLPAASGVHVASGLQASDERVSPLTVLLFGGEPLLEPALVEAIGREVRERERATGVEVDLGLTTNGTLLFGRRLESLARLGYRVAVSLDGPREVHDAARRTVGGRGTWDLVTRRLREAMDHLERLALISVVRPENAAHLPESFDALSSFGIPFLVFTLDLSADWDEPALERLEAGFEALADRAIAHYRAGHDLAVQPLHSKIISRLKGGFTERDQCRFGCGEVAVAPSGNLYPCDRLVGEDGPGQADLLIGHVDAGIDVERVRQLRGCKDAVRPECAACAYVDRCAWWCGCVNRALTGRIDGLSGELCRIEQATIRAADRVASVLFAEANRPFLERYFFAVMPRGALPPG